jgi:transcriptional regulator with XRE-family HTH domain
MSGKNELASPEGAGQSLGEFLRNIRQTRKHTLREVEDGTEVSNAYLSQLENDKISKPSPHILHSLAEFYKVPYEVLMQKAGYIKASPKLRAASLQPKGSVVPASLGPLSREEEEELLKYLAFLRSKQRKGKDE